MRMFRWSVVASLAAVTALVVASQVSARTDRSAADPIKVGISLPITGDFSEPGGAALKGYKVWQRYVNTHGGLLGRKVQLVIKDDQSDQNTIVNDYNALINSNHVDMLLGTFSSLLNLPASAVAEKFHMVYVEPAGGSPKMFNRGFQYLFFAQQATAVHQGDLFSRWVKSLGGKVRTAAYPEQDDPFAAPVAEGIRAKLEAAGIRTVYQTTYAPGTTDFDTIASAIKSSGADVVVQGAVFDDGVGLIRSMKKIDYNPKALFQTSAPSESKAFSDGDRPRQHRGHLLRGELEPEGEGRALPAQPGVPQAVPEEVRQGEDPGGGRGRRVRGRAGAADRGEERSARSTRTRSRTGCTRIRSGTILGPLSWDTTGAPRQAFFLAQWQGGSSQIVAPKIVATTKKVVFPKPGWK